MEELQPHDSSMIPEMVQIVLERNEQSRARLGKLFYNALKANKLNVQNTFVPGMRSLVENVEDLSYDVPLIKLYFAEIIGKL
jgi:hypothetical protein